MKAALLVLAMLVPQLAEAHSSCHEVSKVVGYRHCGRFGLWSVPVSMSLELGISTLVVERPTATTVARDTTGETGGGFLDAHGFMFGYKVSLPHGWYVSNDLTLAFGITDPVTGDSVAIGRDDIGVGYQHTFGRLTIGGDLAGGFRFSDFAPPGVVGRDLVALDGVVDARAQADVWLTPFITLGVQGRVDLLDSHDVAVAVMLGTHLRAFNATR